jgi:sugar phosphate isomerase/epimerase
MDVSFQLYSARNFTPWADVAKLLGELGFTQAEGFGPNYEDAAATRAFLDANGLKMPSGHFSIDMLEHDFAKVLEIAKTLGMQRIYCPYLMPDQRPTDRAGWTAFAQRLAAVCKKLNAAGYPFGWHNHDFEILSCADGAIPMEIILETAPNLDWEADIAWIVRGKGDPMAWIARYGSRITSAHVKDIAKAGENLDQDGWADLGDGVVDWKTVMPALRAAGVKLFVLEHDNPNDLRRYASRSVATFRSL